ncbi:MAG: DMT family transporter [Clostridia bacterium]|nr:DMT family transporter [Clostridia bacterium]
MFYHCFSWAILKDAISWTQLIGGALVMTSVYIVIRQKKTPKDDEKSN